MRKISNFNPARLNNRETVAFLSQVIESSRMIGSESKNDLFTNLETACNEYNSALLIDSTAERTKVIVDKVTLMRKYVDSIALVSKGFIVSPDTKRSAAAKKVSSVVAKYGVLHGSYVETAVKISNIADDLKKLERESLQTIFIDDILDILSGLCDEFTVLYNERNQYSVSIRGAISNARAKAQDFYRDLVTYVNGISVLEPEKYALFIDEVNGIIAKFSLLLPRGKKECEPAEQDIETVPQDC